MTKPAEPALARDSQSPFSQEHAKLIDTSPWRRRFNTIHATLRDRIVLLTYPPGTRLDLDSLSDEFGVSRTPIRNVLQRLERDGLVLTRHGVGTTVTEVDLDRVRDATLLRMHLAEMIGAIHPRQPDQETLNLIDTLAEHVRGLHEREDYSEYVRINLRLHQCTSTLIGSEIFLRLYDELFFRTVRMWYSILPLMDWSTEANSFTDHIELTRSAMIRGDVRAVGLITRNAVSAGLFRLDDHVAGMTSA
ncbi:MAG: GntR family transcriptional regulator [Rhodobacteraceae bacterium]|nr:GntR family transcriptional regulator [Paracoccaceae bacterium]